MLLTLNSITATGGEEIISSAKVHTSRAAAALTASQQRTQVIIARRSGLQPF